jgi:hypothetical protein
VGGIAARMAVASCGFVHPLFALAPPRLLQLQPINDLENISMKPLVSGIALLTASIRNTVLYTTSAHTRPPEMQADVGTNNTKRAASNEGESAT